MSTAPVTPIRQQMSLTIRVRDACRALPGGSTEEICRAVWETLVGPEFGQALVQALPAFVEQYRAGNRPPDPAGTAAGSKPAAPAGRSWKTAAAKQYATEWLNRRIDPAGDYDYKPLGDCSAAELRSYAAAQAQRATRILSDAKWFDNLADALEVAGVSTLGHLPASALKTLEVVP